METQELLRSILEHGHEANPSDRTFYSGTPNFREGGSFLFNLSSNPWEFSTPILAHGGNLSDAWEEAMEFARDHSTADPLSPFRHYVTEDLATAADWIGEDPAKLQKVLEETGEHTELDYHGGSGMIFCSRYWEYRDITQEDMVAAGFPACPDCEKVLSDHSRALPQDKEPFVCGSCNETFSRKRFS